MSSPPGNKQQRRRRAATLDSHALSRAAASATTAAEGDEADGELDAGGQTAARLYGLVRHENGDRYEGQQSETGVPSGYGTYFWRGGDVFRGHWRHGAMHGRGVLVFGASGDKFIGEWQHGRIRGHGKMVLKSGASTEGFFEDGRVVGMSVKAYDSGDVYVGELGPVSETRHGFGAYSCAAALALALAVADNAADAAGLVAAGGSGVVAAGYTGYWRADRMHGQGVWSSPGCFPRLDRASLLALRAARAPAEDTAATIAAATEVRDDLTNCLYYRGPFVSGEREGPGGAVVFADGFRYDGAWRGNLFHGYGRIDYDCHYYEGDFCKGKREGVGLLAARGRTGPGPVAVAGAGAVAVAGAGALVWLVGGAAPVDQADNDDDVGGQEAGGSGSDGDSDGEADDDEEDEDEEDVLAEFQAVQSGAALRSADVEALVQRFASSRAGRRLVGLAYSGAFVNHRPEGWGELSSVGGWQALGRFRAGRLVELADSAPLGDGGGANQE